MKHKDYQIVTITKENSENALRVFFPPYKQGVGGKQYVLFTPLILSNISLI